WNGAVAQPKRSPMPIWILNCSAPEPSPTNLSRTFPMTTSKNPAPSWSPDTGHAGKEAASYEPNLSRLRYVRDGFGGRAARRRRGGTPLHRLTAQPLRSVGRVHHRGPNRIRD